MSTQPRHRNQSIVPEDADSVTTADLVEIVAELEATVREQAETIEEQGEKIDQQAERIDELETELEAERDMRGKQVGETRKDVAELRDTVEGADLTGTDPSPQTEETAVQKPETPIERLSRADDIGEVTDSPSVERAVSLFQNLPDWGSETPKGLVLKPADNPLRLLEADRDESLAWKQYYRAAEALERLSHGAVTFFDSDRHGKMLCLHEQSETYERVQSGLLTPSSVEAEG